MECNGNCAQCGGCAANGGGSVADRVNGCAECAGGVNGCAGCAGGGVLYLTEEEIQLLGVFGEIPFWPLAGRAASEKPVCLERPDMTPGLLLSLAAKGLIRLDFDIPLLNFDYRDYETFPRHGSMALTAQGQRVLELLEIQGAEQ